MLLIRNIIAILNTNLNKRESFNNINNFEIIFAQNFRFFNIANNVANNIVYNIVNKINSIKVNKIIKNVKNEVNNEVNNKITSNFKNKINLLNKDKTI